MVETGDGQLNDRAGEIGPAVALRRMDYDRWWLVARHQCEVPVVDVSIIR